MDEREKELGELELEDILKEFSPEEEVLLDQEDIQLWDGDTPDQPRYESPVASDTVRLDQITKAVRQQEGLEETTRFVLEEAEEPEEMEEPEDPMIITAEEPEVEPYSEEWEPEYEQPMGDYVPPEPIVFRPRNRIMELKKKLIEGPERRYYELVGLGLGKLQTAIFLNLIVALLAAGATALYALGWVPEQRLRLMIFGQCLAVLLSALLGSYQLMDGVASLFKGRFSPNSLLLFSLLACVVDGILCLQQLRIPCSAVFSIHMTMSLWSTYHRRNTEMGQMDTLRKATRLNGLVSVPDFYEERPGFLRNQGEVEDFMESYQKPSAPEKVLSVYALIALFASLGIAVAAGYYHSLEMGMQIFAASLLVSVPATTYITLSRPEVILERRLHKVGTVLCGWRGIKGLSKSGFFPLTDTDLIPVGNAKMNGVKFYGSRKPDEVVAYAAAVVAADGGSMVPLFNQLLEIRNGYHYDVESLHNYGNGGVGGVVNDEAVLVGTLPFMQSMGVEMPEGNRVKQAVYVAIDGELSGVFAVSYSRVQPAETGMATLCSYRGVKPVLTTGDFVLTESFLHNRFGVNTRRIAFPPRDVRKELANFEVPEDAQAMALATQSGLSGFGYAVTGARNLRTAMVTGVAVHMIGGILGLLIMAVLAFVGADYLISSESILLYELLWMIPGLLISEWTRNI